MENSHVSQYSGYQSRQEYYSVKSHHEQNGHHGYLLEQPWRGKQQSNSYSTTARSFYAFPLQTFELREISSKLLAGRDSLVIVNFAHALSRDSPGIYSMTIPESSSFSSSSSSPKLAL